MREEIGVLDATIGEDAGFESRDAIETPLGVGQALDQFRFALADRLVIADEAIDVTPIFFSIVARKQNCTSRQAGLDGVER